MDGGKIQTVSTAQKHRGAPVKMAPNTAAPEKRRRWIVAHGPHLLEQLPMN